MDEQRKRVKERPFLWVGLLALCVVSLFSVGCATVTQSEDCRAYVACLAARDAKLKIQTDYKRFEAGGVCWGGPGGADLCTRACKNGRAWLKKAYQDLPAACK